MIELDGCSENGKYFLTSQGLWSGAGGKQDVKLDELA